MEMEIMIAPSLMCMDFLQVGQQISIFNKHMDLLHFDMMDGHYCRNLALCPDILRQVKSISQLPVDVHVMLENPENFLDAVLECGADYISLHTDCINKSAFSTINRIKDAGRKVGIVLHPSTPLSAIMEYAQYIDMLTVMTVDIGFAGQKFIREMLRKIEQAKELKKTHGYSFIVQVDGAVNHLSIPDLASVGTECYIVGTSGLFSLDKDLESACRMVRQQIAEAARSAGYAK